MKPSGWIFAIAISFGPTLSVSAQSVPLVNVDPATDCPSGVCSDEPNSGATWGWTFYVNAPIEVTHIGWCDKNGDGIFPTRVGLWKDVTGATAWPYVGAGAQQFLGNNGLVIPGAATADLDGPWRKLELSLGPFTLQPGGYVVGGAGDTDAIRYMLDHAGPGLPTTLPVDPRIQIGAPGYSQSSGFHQPDFFFLVYGVEFGPMLFVTLVPEPAAVSLLGLAMLGCGLFSQRSRHFLYNSSEKETNFA